MFGEKGLAGACGCGRAKKGLAASKKGMLGIILIVSRAAARPSAGTWSPPAIIVAIHEIIATLVARRSTGTSDDWGDEPFLLLDIMSRLGDSSVGGGVVVA